MVIISQNNAIDISQIPSVLGTPTDTVGTDSINGRTKSLEAHIHAAPFSYPKLAGSIVLTKAAGTWAAYPTKIEIVPANTRISACISSSNAAANTINIKLDGHYYLS